jgi:hypothetical protein
MANPEKYKKWKWKREEPEITTWDCEICNVERLDSEPFYWVSPPRPRVDTSDILACIDCARRAGIEW